MGAALIASAVRRRRMVEALAGVCAALIVAVVSSRAAAQDTMAVVVPPPPGASAASPSMGPGICAADLEWHAQRCMHRGTHYVLGWEPGLVAAGFALFAGMYALQALSTAVSVAQAQHDLALGYSPQRLADYERWGYVPVIGPWAKLALAPPSVDSAGGTLFVFEGLLELAGVVAAVTSLFTHVEDEWTDPEAVSVRIVPTAFGLAAFGQF